MPTAPGLLAGRFPGRWILASGLGWLLGVVLVVVLSMGWDLLGGGSQFMVGVGMGAGVGLVQARIAPPRVTSARRWFAASTIGLGIPYLLWDVGVGLGIPSLPAMWICTVAGGLLVAALQHRLILPPRPRALAWAAACAAGWSMPEWLIGLSDAGLLPGRWDLLSIGGVLLGGVFLGALTGPVLRPSPPSST